ncbi:MAG: SH3 domain-containing protein [Elusimicrobia bacterium]|nr:SH3 domain-containing protein [Elusimicrobiota bacterium]
MKYLKLILSVLALLLYIVLINARAEGKKYVTAESGLILREAPDRKSNKIITIPYNAEVTINQYAQKPITVEDITADWVKIMYYSYTGWVFDGFLSAEKQKHILSSHGLVFENMKPIMLGNLIYSFPKEDDFNNLMMDLLSETNKRQKFIELMIKHIKQNAQMNTRGKKYYKRNIMYRELSYGRWQAERYPDINFIDNPEINISGLEIDFIIKCTLIKNHEDTYLICGRFSTTDDDRKKIGFRVGIDNNLNIFKLYDLFDSGYFDNSTSKAYGIKTPDGFGDIIFLPITYGGSSYDGKYRKALLVFGPDQTGDTQCLEYLYIFDFSETNSTNDVTAKLRIIQRPNYSFPLLVYDYDAYYEQSINSLEPIDYDLYKKSKKIVVILSWDDKTGEYTCEINSAQPRLKIINE